MSRLKDDLICEIIRVSQTNLLGKKQSEENGGESGVVEWIRKNAADYRRIFMDRLDSFSTSELGEILSQLNQTGKDLNQLLEGSSWTPQSKPSR